MMSRKPVSHTVGIFSVISFAFLVGSALACGNPLCDHVQLNSFQSGEQHSDCQYETGYTRQGPPSELQNERDYYWTRFAMDYGMNVGPSAPFAAAIVNYTSNKLLCVSVNMKALDNKEWSWRWNSHGEVVALENCTELHLPDIVVNGKKVTNPGWNDMIMYDTVEPCPMCAQTILYRAIPRLVFGARASKLAEKRCWTQSTLTMQEVADHAITQFNMTYLRGPLPDLEQEILDGFQTRCA